jgi:hypothetical protein
VCGAFVMCDTFVVCVVHRGKEISSLRRNAAGGAAGGVAHNCVAGDVIGN